MVVVSRRGEGGYEPLPYAQTPDPGKRRGSLVFGSPSRPYTNDAGWASPVIKMLSPKKLSTSPSSFSTSFYPKSSRSERGEINHWLVKVIYAAAAVSWIATRMLSRDYPSVIATMENDALIIKAQMEHMLDDLEAVNTYVNKERQTLNQLKKTRGALDHEIRLITEVEKTTGSRIKPAPRSTNEQLIKGWLNHRTDSLLTKIYYLQRYLQASSRTTVLERFGVGPHRVKFNVDLIDEGGKRNLKSFVVETSPVDLMPTSNHFFLDMVTAGIWDNTIFLHHEEVSHVIAAAPVDSVTQKVKHNQLSYLGWIGIGFPEYTDQFPHKKYTLGFAGQGPTFYINTMDNENDHGPGGQQGHHLLPNDADPCFAKVVEGFEVVDDLVRLGLIQKKTEGNGSHPWADDVHTWTHIVSAKLLKD